VTASEYRNVACPLLFIPHPSPLDRVPAPSRFITSTHADCSPLRLGTRTDPVQPKLDHVIHHKICRLLIEGRGREANWRNRIGGGGADLWLGKVIKRFRVFLQSLSYMDRTIANGSHLGVNWFDTRQLLLRVFVVFLRLSGKFSERYLKLGDGVSLSHSCSFIIHDDHPHHFNTRRVRF
jgi:hypothetical protein